MFRCHLEHQSSPRLLTSKRTFSRRNVHPQAKSTPEPEARHASEPGPAAAQPQLERTPIQETTSLPPTTGPVPLLCSKGFMPFTPRIFSLSLTPPNAIDNWKMLVSIPSRLESADRILMWHPQPAVGADFSTTFAFPQGKAPDDIGARHRRNVYDSWFLLRITSRVNRTACPTDRSPLLVTNTPGVLPTVPARIAS